MLKPTAEVKLTWKTGGFLLALGLAALCGVAVVLSGAEVLVEPTPNSPKEFWCRSHLLYRGVKIFTSNEENSGTNDPLWLCVDDDSCCEKLQPQEDCPAYVQGSTEFMIAPCGDMSRYSRVKLVASGGNAWRGHLTMIGDKSVSPGKRDQHNELVLSTNPNSEIDGTKAKRGVSFKRVQGIWEIDESVVVPFDFYPHPWNVKLTTSDVANAGTDDALMFCVDDCCEKLTHSGENNYERGDTDHFLSNCDAPTDASTLKLVARGDDMWVGRLKLIFDQTVEPTLQPLALSTQSTDEINGIQAKRGVTFKKQADGRWHYDEDVPFDWYPFAWNVKLTTSGVDLANTNDPLYLCVDDCCDKLDNDFLDDYEGHVPDFFLTNCAAPTDASSLKLVSSGGDAWMGQLESVFGQTVHHSLQPLVLSTQRSDEIDGIASKRGVSFKKQADGEWHFDEDLPYYFYLKPWNVQFTTSDVANAGTDDPLWVCVDDCCDKLDNVGVDDYERGNTDHFLSNCDAPTDASTIKLVSSGDDMWMGYLNEIYGQPVEHTLQPLVLSTEASDKINGIASKRGVSFKKQADGQWHYDEDIPFYFSLKPWNVQFTTSDVAMAGTDDSLLFCVDDCCEKLNNIGEDNYERGETDHFLSNCGAPTDASTLKLVASGGDAWMGYLNEIYGQTVHHSLQPLVLSTQPSDEIDGITAKRGVSFKKQADGEWHFDEDLPFDYLVWNVKLTTKDVTNAGTDDCLFFCVDDCCEKLNNVGEDNYERGNTDYFLSNCEPPTDDSIIKLLATGGNGWIGTLQNVYGTEVVEYELKLSTQFSDFSYMATRGAVFRKYSVAGGLWHWSSKVDY